MGAIWNVTSRLLLLRSGSSSSGLNCWCTNTFFFEGQLVADLTVEKECIELIFETVWLLAQVCRVARYTQRISWHPTRTYPRTLDENILGPYTPRGFGIMCEYPCGTIRYQNYCSRIHRTLFLHCAHQHHCRCTVPFYCTWIHRTLLCCSRMRWYSLRHPQHTCWCTNWTCSSNVTALERWRSVLYTSVQHSSQNHSDSISQKSTLWILFFVHEFDAPVECDRTRTLVVNI